MKPILVIVDDQQMGRQKNIFTNYHPVQHLGYPFDESRKKWEQFEQSVITYPAPGLEPGEHECYLIDQYKWRDKEWHDNTPTFDQRYYELQGWETRQIYRAVAVTKEVEETDSEINRLKSLLSVKDTQIEILIEQLTLNGIKPIILKRR